MFSRQVFQYGGAPNMLTELQEVYIISSTAQAFSSFYSFECSY
jgi:hypothetical protein